ncbi:ABC transporter ATP-binding protein [Geobacter argillaceus]|uniref:Branched-chain amino acid transport system ATP-binding protein n=1 Tax=Geobacter argillaceus TaxID=345631 RepID=A0A562VJ69_9BACT|nr:ABC transporter ATP-binding protein [Geobacter argillaceus]TWJ17787.1 branched-chain amino acid transport system ATP-binding protein [Geobacter argillaceus]
MLTLEHVYAGYGEAIVIDDCSLTMAEGESIALLGRNGVGKSSLLLTVMGHTKVHRGSIRWCGQDLVKVPQHARARAGLGWVPQEREIFKSLTVEENLTVTALPGKWDLKSIYALFPRLQERRRNFGNQLSGGEQQMLAIGRALMLNPKVLLLDEPLEGLAPVIADELCISIQRMIRDEGQSLILVEQHVEQALCLTHRAIVLERGRVVHNAQCSDLLGNLSVLEKWVGVRVAHP